MLPARTTPASRSRCGAREAVGEIAGVARELRSRGAGCTAEDDLERFGEPFGGEPGAREEPRQERRALGRAGLEERGEALRPRSRDGAPPGSTATARGPRGREAAGERPQLLRREAAAAGAGRVRRRAARREVVGHLEVARRRRPSSLLCYGASAMELAPASAADLRGRSRTPGYPRSAGRVSPARCCRSW